VAGAACAAFALALPPARAAATCPASPASGCEASHDASLKVDERRPGNEKLSAALRMIVGHIQLAAFGDPLRPDSPATLVSCARSPSTIGPSASLAAAASASAGARST
jgi:hypothetical protein